MATTTGENYYNGIWGRWISTSTSSTTLDYSTSSTVIWRSWNQDSSTSSSAEYSNEYTWTSWVVSDNRTREQKRAEQAQNTINDYKEKQKEQDAETTAIDLLKDLISEEEMELYLQTGRLLVKGKEFDYVLEKGYQAKVFKIKKGKIISLKDHKKVKTRSLCVHPINQGELPETDKIISMKVALETEEKRMLQLANDHGERELDLAVNN